MAKKMNLRWKTLVIGLFAVYILFLIWIILFKLQLSFENLDKSRSLNLIPLGGSAIVNGKIDFSEIVNNVFVFLPFGVYLSLLKPDWGWQKKILPILGYSFLLELLQYAFAIGATDITDLISNTMGGVLGIAIYNGSALLLKQKTQAIWRWIVLIGTIITVLFLTFLLWANM